MVTIQTELPERLYQEARRLAQQENVSVERLFSLAVAQAVGAWQTQSVIAERTGRASRGDFLRVLDAVPDVPPAPGDELPAGLVRRAD